MRARLYCAEALPALRRPLEQIGGDAEVLLDPVAFGDERAERELRIGIAEIGGLGIVVGGLAEILSDAEPFLIDLAHEGVGLLRALRRLLLGELERGQILALEIGGVGRAFLGACRARDKRQEQRRGEQDLAALDKTHAALLTPEIALPISATRLTASSSCQISLEGAMKSAPSSASFRAASVASMLKATHGTTKISAHQAISSAH